MIEITDHDAAAAPLPVGRCGATVLVLLDGYRWVMVPPGDPIADYLVGRDTDDQAKLTESAETYLANGEQVSSLLPRLEELRAEKLVVERAVDIARTRFYAAKESKNREAVAALRPVHREAAARVAAAVVALAQANAAESKIRYQAPGGALPSCSFPGVDLGRSDSQASHFLKYLRRVYSIEPAPRTEAVK